MAERAIVGKVNPGGDGLAIYLGHDGGPEWVGDVLLNHYSEEASIARLVELGSVTWLHATPEQCISYHRHYRYDWEVCRPYEFEGGTERFFQIYWNAMAEWLYVWTPDGWLASPAMPGAPPDIFHETPRVKERLDADPEWQEWLRRTQEVQQAQPLSALIKSYAQKE